MKPVEDFSLIKRNNNITMKHLIKYFLFCLPVLFLSGCGPAIGVVIDMMPKADIPAQFEMKNKKVLVYVKSIAPDEISPVYIHTFSNQLNRELVKNKAVGTIVDYSKVSDLMLDSSGVVSAEYAGKELKADITLKIEIQHLTFDYRSADECRVGQMMCFLTVLDAKTLDRLWPENQLKKALMINSKLEINSDDNLSTSQIQRDLATNSAKQIAKIFYKHKAE